MKRLSMLLCASTLVTLAWAAPARADGGFPDPRQILLPAERPEQVIVATNFGLLFSEDAGASWSFSCEQSLAAYAGPYLLAPRPSTRIVAIAPGAGFIYSDDDSCTWQSAQGTVASVLPYALALDPSSPERVYVVGAPRDDLRSGESIYASQDGGLTFGEPLFTAPIGNALMNVLVAPTQPSTLYAAMYEGASRHPVLLRSDDHGQHWEMVADHQTTFGDSPFELLSIDPNDPHRLFARVLGSSAESLAISDDAGATFRLTASIPGKLNAFLQLESGTLLVAGQAGTDAIAYRSPDGGETFAPWPAPPRIHALAERAGKLYLAADNYLDGYAIGDSDDEGLTIRPLAGFKDVSTVKSCVRDACTESCRYQAGINLWPEAVCGRAVPSEPSEPRDVPDAGAGGANGGEGEPQGGRVSASAPTTTSPRALGGGCSCSVVARKRLQPVPLLLVAALFALGAARRRARIDRNERRVSFSS